MVEVKRSNPHWGLDLPFHFGKAGVATRFANCENVSRTDDRPLRLRGKGLLRRRRPPLNLRASPLVKYLAFEGSRNT